MRKRNCLAAAIYAACTSAAVSCAPTSQVPSVTFGSSDAGGRWETESSNEAADAAVEPDISDAPPGSIAPQLTAAAGRSAPMTTTMDVDAGATQPKAGSGSPAADSGSNQPNVASLSFEVTTSGAGGRYQPKNIGAIWIEDDNGDVVKTLQVWAGSRRRYLTGYLGAMAGSKIDVTASATLPRHQTHTVSWNLKDKSGAAVAPGTYHVRMELTDGNQTGKSNTLDFDTSQGPKTLSPSDAPSFGAMKLVLQ